MNKILFLLTMVVLSFVLSGCELEGKKIIELRNEVRYLETELASVRAAPGFMFGEAFEFVDAKDYGEAVQLLKQLQSEFPEWNKEIVITYMDKYQKLVPADADTTRRVDLID